MRAINRNKIIAVMAAIVVFMVSMCTYSAEANATNTSRTYKVYDAQTGTYLRQYTLSALDDYNNSGNARTAGVFESDDRNPDPTNNGVVFISASGFGTGFIIGDHLIATAAHCVYDDSINNITLLNQEGGISGYATPIEYHIPVNYINNDDTDGYDYALISVEEDLSNYPYFELGVATDSIAEQNLDVSITGFPGVVEGETVNGYGIPIIFTGDGDIVRVNETQILVDVDATPGNSGSPLYIEESRGIYNYQTAIGIMFANSSYGDGSNAPNVCLRFTTDTIHFYKNNSNINYE